MQYRADTSDNELLDGIKDGQKKAFDFFFLRHYAILCAYAKQYVDIHDAEEIVQDFMVKLWEQRGDLNINTSVKGYLFTSIRNSCLTSISIGKVRQRIISAMHDKMDYIYDSPNFYVLEELSKLIESAINNLPESYKEAFELNRFKGMTYSKIAEQLKVSPKTIDYRIQQALKILRHDLKDYLPLLILGL